MVDDGKISFYDVRTRRSVSIPSGDVRTVVYENTTRDGRLQLRYALRGKFESRNLTKFVSRAAAATHDAGFALIEASSVPPVLEPSAIAMLDESIAVSSLGEEPIGTPRSFRLIEAAVRVLEELRDGKMLLDEVDAEVFEYLTAELQIRLGYEDVQVTSRSADGGVDVFAALRDPTGKKLQFVTQCKRYRKDRGVDREHVSALYGVVELRRVSGGMLFASSFFTPSAKALEEQLSPRVAIYDRQSMYRMIKEVG